MYSTGQTPIAAGRRLPGRRRPRRPAGSRTPGTDRHAWLARSIPGLPWRQRLQQMAGQRIEQKMASAEIGRGGPDALCGDELNGGGRSGPSGRCPLSCAAAGATHPGQTDLDPARRRAGITLGGPAPAGFRRTGLRRPALFAASCQVRPRASRTGRPRSAGMTQVPGPADGEVPGGKGMRTSSSPVNYPGAMAAPSQTSVPARPSFTVKASLSETPLALWRCGVCRSPAGTARAPISRWSLSSVHWELDDRPVAVAGDGRLAWGCDAGAGEV